MEPQPLTACQLAPSEEGTQEPCKRLSPTCFLLRNLARRESWCIAHTSLHFPRDWHRVDFVTALGRPPLGALLRGGVPLMLCGSPVVPGTLACHRPWGHKELDMT